MVRTALVTGSAGFIGFHLSRRLLADGWRVIGFDAMTDYYDVSLKQRRLEILQGSDSFTTVEARLEEPGRLTELMAEHRPDVVVHLAAQAGVRYSLEAPRSYVESNLMGTFELLEAARAYPPAHMLMASTSSVYGANTDMPYAETDKVDTQMSFYAATKKSNEAMAHSYSHLFNLPVTMFRFFTVYGPWGRPDMALFKFVKAMREGKPIDVYNHGRMKRDFTYVEDLVEGVVRLIDVVPPAPEMRDSAIEGDSLSPVAPWRVVNIGLSQPVELGDFIAAIETAMGTEAAKNYMDMQPGDVPATWADTRLLTALVGELPATPLAKGVGAFVRWYEEKNWD
ncbi:NAD-dependent epimerase/dehydratase family protein [Tropicimonas marinistellae]|uniref:NAD-dependent epimerase/dehydratase family protein n=1 Tax=Tropicimonas marinistellae TaxID=1739787 RepID=UPI00083128D9|nr:NAD-dependent epimerase/dehydratase family protein [Tropicimonas marinistellae]